jgi:hypothetical protein
MDEAIRNHVFGHSSPPSTSAMAAGLGLSTAYGIVRRFGGQIQLDSQPGANARASRFSFPSRKQTPANPRPHPRRKNSSNNRKSRPLLMNQARSQFFPSITQSPCARPAIRFWSRKARWTLSSSPASIPARSTFLTDAVMPEFRRPELARQVQDRHPNIHVTDVRIRGSWHGPGHPPEAAFLQKPFRFATLTEQLKLLPRRA